MPAHTRNFWRNSKFSAIIEISSALYPAWWLVYFCTALSILPIILWSQDTCTCPQNLANSQATVHKTWSIGNCLSQIYSPSHNPRACWNRYNYTSDEAHWSVASNCLTALPATSVPKHMHHSCTWVLEQWMSGNQLSQKSPQQCGSYYAG